MADGQPGAVAAWAGGWRRWLVIGVIGGAFACQLLLRSAHSHWRGVIVTQADNVTSYRLSPWWLAVFAVPAGLIALLGLAIVTVRHALARLVGAVVLLAALFIVVAVAPLPGTDGLKVTPDGFTHTAGFWWRPKTTVVRFDALEAIRLVHERNGDGSRLSLLECRRRDGTVTRIPQSTLLEAGLRRIFVLAARRGVVVGVDDLAGAGPRPGPGLAPTWRPSYILAVLAVSAVAYVALRFAREPDRGVREAQSRANAGDVEGAIGHLREVIEEKGPTQHRVNTLGNLLFQAKRYGEAAAQYRKAEQLGPLPGVCRANLGLALLEGGKPDEALPVLEEAARLADGTPVLEHMIALHTCLALADLGRWPEARAEFQRAETIASRLPRSERKALAPHVEKCRTRLEAAGDGAGEPLRR